jgi:hypothetical protein
MMFRIIVAAAVVLLLAAVGWQWHADEADAREHTLTSLDPETATQMALTLKGLPDQRFERRNGRWVNLDTASTDEGRAEELVSLAVTPVTDWKPAADFDPAKLGLAPPVAILTIDATRIEFGEMTALGKQRYVRVGQRIAFVPAQALPRAPRTQALPTVMKPVQ